MKSRRENMYSASKQDSAGHRKTKNVYNEKEEKIRGQLPTIVRDTMDAGVDRMSTIARLQTVTPNR
jgi:hypothetical protein